MGELLKPRVLSKEQAKQKLDADIAEAHARYERRLRLLEEQDAELARRIESNEPLLGGRAERGLRYAVSATLPKIENPFGRLEMGWFEGEITPQIASKLSGAQLLDVPNFGHKAISEIAAWLRFHGYELKP